VARDHVRERRVGGALEHATEDVDRERVVERGAGRALERHGREPAQVLGEREAWLIEPARDLRAVERTIGRLQERIAEAARVGE